MKLYELSNSDIEKKFDTNIEYGLDKNEVNKRLIKFGYNVLKETPKESYFILFLKQFKNPLIYILLFASIISLFIGHFFDAILISFILIFNSTIGTLQEAKTRNILSSLKKLIKTEVIVIRDDNRQIIEEKFLVPGDLIILQQGEKIPADARIIECTDLKIDEAAFTGESTEIDKIAHPLNGNLTLFEQKNMVFQGTYVLAGIGKAIVVATGSSTEIGKLKEKVEKIEPPVPLQLEIKKLSLIILILITLICFFLFIFAILQGKAIYSVLATLISLFVSVVPEGLPAMLTLVLVVNAYRMASQKVLIKNLSSVDTLGRVDIIMLDKTGTLTRNEMMVTKIYCEEKIFDVSGEGYFTKGFITHNSQKVEIYPESNLYLLGKAVSLLNRSEISYDKDLKLFKIKGDPTNAAQYIFSKKLDISKSKLEQEYKLLYEIPFSSHNRYHAAFYKYKNEVILFISGSPEIIINLSQKNDHQLDNVLNNFLEEGLRVIGVATKKFKAEEIDKINDFKLLKQKINELIFLGLIGIQDDVRDDVNNYVEEAKKAGIRLIMVTGDHKRTALYVAKKTGILGNNYIAIEGKDFDKLSQKEKIQEIDKIAVFARVSPENKLEIAQLLHKEGNIVAMTGDGVNDVPSLAAADIGIAMGSIGTEVAKEAADIVLIDDSFANIMHGIELGRHAFYTLKKIILYFLSTNLGEILLIFFSFLFNLPLPLIAAQILWINLVTDCFLDSALVMEPLEKETIIYRWKKIKGKLINRDLLIHVAFLAILMSICSIIIFALYYKQNINKARTLTLVTMSLFQWFNVWNCRSEYKSIFKIKFFSNKWLIYATIFVFLLQFFVVYNSWMQSIFKTTYLTLIEWIICIIIASTIIFAEEIRKAIINRASPKLY